MNITLLVSVILLIALVAYFIYSYRKMKNMPLVENSSKISELTDKNFSNQVKNGITIVDFWAAWCAPCRMMAPILNQLAEEAKYGVKVCKVDVEQYQSLASKYSIKGIPTMILFRDGKEVNRIVGVKTKEFIESQIKKSL